MLIVLTFSSEEERDKFEYIFTHYKKLVMHKTYSILHDYMLAEDAASEAFIRIYRNIHKIGDPTEPRSVSFIVTIAKNAALTMLKQDKLREAEPLDETQQDGFDVEEHVISRLSSERIHAVIDGLGEELKSVFLLKYAHGMSHREIGQALGITENNVTVRMHRMKKKLSDLLRKEGYDDEKQR